MASLRPLDADLTRECREFAEALRTLFGVLDVSVRRYGARRFRDAGSISRFLSGTRVPPWQFVVELLDDVAECRGGPETPESIARLQRLHGAAFPHGSVATGSAKALELQLAEAELDARRSSADEEFLGDVLVDRNNRIAELEARLTQLEATWSGAARSPQHTVLDSEREALTMQVRRLSDELETTRRAAWRPKHGATSWNDNSPS